MRSGVEEDGGGKEEERACEPERRGEEVRVLLFVGTARAEHLSLGGGGIIVVDRVAAWRGQERLRVFLVWGAHGVLGGR